MMNASAWLSGDINPVAFSQESCRIMVVTEQPREDFATLEWKVAREGFERSSLPSKLNDLLQGRFFKEFRRRIYWTHYIKCPGRIRGRDAPKRRFLRHSCAERFLPREISALRPSLIIAVGAHSASFILSRAEPRMRDWRDLLWRELEASILDRLPDLPLIDGAKVFVLMHPSGANPGSFLNVRLKPLINRMLEAHLCRC
jgi:uracil-DNA glycosylase